MAGHRGHEDERQRDQARDDIQRVEPDQPDDGEVGEAHPRAQPCLIGMGEDEAAEDEEQVDREIAFRRQVADRVLGDVPERDRERRDAAQPVERVEGAPRSGPRRHWPASWWSSRPSSQRRWKPGQ